MLLSHPYSYTTIWLSLSRSASFFFSHDEKFGFRFLWFRYASAHFLSIFFNTRDFFSRIRYNRGERFVCSDNRMAVPNNARFEEDEERLEEIVAWIRDL